MPTAQTCVYSEAPGGFSLPSLTYFTSSQLQTRLVVILGASKGDLNITHPAVLVSPVLERFARCDARDLHKAARSTTDGLLPFMKHKISQDCVSNLLIEAHSLFQLLVQAYDFI